MNQLIHKEQSGDSYGGLANPGAVDVFYKLYEKVNETNKEISKIYDENLLIEFSDIHELHYKIIQSINVFKPKTISVKICIEQFEGESHIFNDFDSFKKNNTTSPCATQEVYMQYKFLLLDEGLSKYETYGVNCRLSSKLATIEQVKKNAPSIVYEMISSMQQNVAGINIEYVDYVKARVFIAAFDEWVKGCKESHKSSFINFMKKNSKWIVFLGKVFTLLVLGLFTVNSIPDEYNDTLFYVKVLILYITVFYCIKMVSHSIFNQIKRFFETYIYISYVKINKGDEKLIENFNHEKINNIRRLILNVVGAILIGVSSCYLYDLIKIIIK